jgi:hypothetical protein
MINIYYFLSSIGIYGSMAYYLLHHSAVSGTPAETLGILVLRPRYDLPSQSTLKHNSVHFLKKISNIVLSKCPYMLQICI